MKPDLSTNPHYLAAFQELAGRKAERSGLPYLNHVREGVQILRFLGASQRAVDAFCLHPLVQSDEDLKTHLVDGSILTRLHIDPLALATAIEYRSVANHYLSHDPVRPTDQIRLSPLADVNHMLIADKVQNRKGFEHHNSAHPRAEHLAAYFDSWLSALGVSEQDYEDLVVMLEESSLE